jgi:hypothetical protein
MLFLHVQIDQRRAKTSMRISALPFLPTIQPIAKHVRNVGPR